MSAPCFPSQWRNLPTRRLWVLLVFFLCQPSLAATIQARVIDVPTAQHLLLLNNSGQRYVVELYGISIQQLNQRQRHQIRKRLIGLVMGKPVTAEVTQIDHKQIMSARVLLGGLDINLRLIRQGLARVNQLPNTPGAYLQAETKARDENMGIWSRTSRKH